MKDHKKKHYELEDRVSRHELQIKNIETILNEIKDDTKWVKRTIMTSIIGLAITTFGAFVVWAAGGFGG